MERVVSTVGFSLGNDHFTDLDYADDVALPANTVYDLHTALVIFEKKSVKTWFTCVLAEDKMDSSDSNTSNL